MDTKPTLTSVIPELPPNWVVPNGWNDKVIEPEPSVPTLLFEQQKGQRWWVKLPGGITLVDVEILDITLKTVRIESSNRFMQPAARYARADIEFIEQIDA